MQPHEVPISGDSPQPKYLQLREILIDLLAGLPMDGALPSERELAARYGVARMTVRRAIDELAAEGLVYRVPGRGAFVAQGKVEVKVRLASFSEEMAQRGVVAGSRPLRFERVRATPFLAQRLRVAAGDSLVRLDRLRTADSVPYVVESVHLPEKLVPGLLDLEPPESLYRYLESIGRDPDVGEHMIDGGIATEEESSLLDLVHPWPVLRITRFSYSRGELIEYSNAAFRADKYKLWVPVSRDGAARPLNSQLRDRT